MTEKMIKTRARAVPYQRVSRTRSGIGQLLVGRDDTKLFRSLVVCLVYTERTSESEGCFVIELVGF
jgi:hypothetical protein